MAKPKSARLPKRHENNLKRMVDDDLAEHEGEAMRMALDAGFDTLGYQNGYQTDTRLRWLVHESAKAVGLLGVMWVGMSLFFPVEWRLFGALLLIGALGLAGLDRVLERREPAISQRLFGGGEPA